MTWTYEQIRRDSLGDVQIAAHPQQVVAAFEKCEQLLGRQWINECVGTTIDALPTLVVVKIGRALESLNGVKDTKNLIAKLTKHDTSAAAELEAIHLLRSHSKTSVELEPTVQVAGVKKKPDFRIRHNQEPWIYTEVTQPDMSEAQKRVGEINEELCTVIESSSNSFDLEVFLRREPTNTEVQQVLQSMKHFCTSTRQGTKELPDGLGLLILAEQPLRPIEPRNHGEAPCPRLGAAKVKIENGIATKRVVVRMPYSDKRAQRFLNTESKQLPEDSPGLMMVRMTKALSGFNSWEPVIERWFQNNAQLGAVCLFYSGPVPTERGIAIMQDTKLLRNPHATNAIPFWIEVAVEAAGAEFKASVRQQRAG